MLLRLCVLNGPCGINIQAPFCPCPPALRSCMPLASKRGYSSSDETKRRLEDMRNATPTGEEITMTEQESTKEYRVTVRGQLETTTEVFAVNEAVARMRVEDHRWTKVYRDLEGDEGSERPS